jgi:hypothetical protein
MQMIIVKLLSRSKQAVGFQEILTRYGCDIHVRMGLHEHNHGVCTDEGVIILQLHPESKVAGKMMKDLKSLGKIQVKLVEF